MKGFPKNLKTKQDFLNCIAEYGKEKTLAVFGRILIDDTKVERVASYDLDEKIGEMSNLKTEIVENPAPTWQRMGFAGRDDMMKFKETGEVQNVK